MVGLAGCSGGTSDEDAIRASLASELDSIKNIDDAFVNEFSESIDMSQLSVYGIDGVELAATKPITITYTKVDGTWEPASSTSGDIAAALMTN